MITTLNQAENYLWGAWRYPSLIYNVKKIPPEWCLSWLVNYLICYFADGAAVAQSASKIANQCPFPPCPAYRLLLHGGDWIIWWLIDLTGTRHRRAMESVFFFTLKFWTALILFPVLSNACANLQWFYIKRSIRGYIECIKCMKIL